MWALHPEMSRLCNARTLAPTWPLWYSSARVRPALGRAPATLEVGPLAGRVRWTALGVGTALLGVSSSLLASPVVADGRMLRIAESTGPNAVAVPLTTSGAQESVGTSFVHLAERANGA